MHRMKISLLCFFNKLLTRWWFQLFWMVLPLKLSRWSNLMHEISYFSKKWVDYQPPTKNSQSFFFRRHIPRCRAKKCCRGVTRYHPVKIDRETLADLRHPGVQKSGGEFQSRWRAPIIKTNERSLNGKLEGWKKMNVIYIKEFDTVTPKNKVSSVKFMLPSLNEKSEVDFLGGGFL